MLIMDLDTLIKWTEKSVEALADYVLDYTCINIHGPVVYGHERAVGPIDRGPVTRPWDWTLYSQTEVMTLTQSNPWCIRSAPSPPAGSDKNEYRPYIEIQPHNTSCSTQILNFWAI